MLIFGASCIRDLTVFDVYLITRCFFCAENNAYKTATTLYALFSVSYNAAVATICRLQTNVLSNQSGTLYIDGLVQEWCNPSALAVELRLSSTNQSICMVQVCLISASSQIKCQSIFSILWNFIALIFRKDTQVFENHTRWHVEIGRH